MCFDAHPYSRVLATLCVIAVTTFGNTEMLLFANAAFLIFGAVVGTVRSQCRLLLAAVLPLWFVLAMVWGVFLQTAPGGELGVNPWGGFHHATTLALRVGLLGSALQALWLSVEPQDVPAFLRSLGLQGDKLILVLSLLGGFHIVRQTVHNVHTALVIRGKIRQNSPLSRVIALPTVFLNIWAPTLSQAIARVEMKWEPTQFLDIAHVSNDKYHNKTKHDFYSILFSSLIILATIYPLWMK